LAGRELRELFVPWLASIGPRNVASLLLREAVMVTMMVEHDDAAISSTIRDLTRAYLRGMSSAERKSLRETGRSIDLQRAIGR
jgi:hypothetical protein